jgi:copper transport protein
VRRIATLLAAAALAALAAPVAASAHATLLQMTPANGAILERAPRAVDVRFDDTVRAGSGNAAVANATGASVQAGPAQARGHLLTIPLADHLDRGSYSVRWSIVSDDGHREEGVLAFSVGTGLPPQAVLTARTPLGWWAVGFRFLFYAGVLAAGGLALFGARRDVRRELRVPLAHALFAALLLAFLGASGAVHAAPAGTRNAHVLDVALAISLVGAAAAALAPRSEPLLYLAGACAFALVAAPTLSGHALDPNQRRWLAVPADLAHIAAASAWLGGLVALLALVPRLSAPSRAAATRRISATAFAAVPLLAAAGVLRAVTELSAVHQLWTTSYGRALLVKTALFVPAVALGWLNRTRLLAAVAALRRSVRVELVLLAGVVAVVGVLVALRPGRDAVAARTTAAPAVPQPPVLPPRDAVVAAAEDGALAVGVARSPSAVTVTLLGPDGTGADRTVRVNGGPTTRCGAGCYRARPQSGALRVAIDGRTLVFALPAAAPDASAQLQRATRAYRGASSIAFDESLRSGPTGGVQTRWTVKAPHSLAYTIRRGPQAIVIGTRRWDRASARAPWQKAQQTPLDVTRPYWTRPTNVRLVAPRTLTFLDRSLPAWFRVTLDARGRPRTMRMIAAAHFMSDRYVAYDAPVALSPPSR